MIELINAGLTDINVLREASHMQNARNREIQNTAQQNAAGLIPNPLQGEAGLSNKKAADTTRSDNKKEKESGKESGQTKSGKTTNKGELTEEQKREVAELKAIDRKVRQHEMAHLAAAGGIAISGANFQYKQGPDGMNYAVAGEVSIDTSKDKDPQKTIEKARQIIAAANAPADPSPQDRQVAAQAQSMQAQAQQELARERQAQLSGNTDKTQNKETNPKSPNQTNTPTNSPHPGIKEYQKNQTFAPFSPTQDNTTNNSSIGSVKPMVKPGMTLDMVA